MITQEMTYKVAKEHGFQDYFDNPLYVPTKLALIMSECAEALEWHRMGKSEELPHELADIVIRTMDLAESLGIDLQKAIEIKHEFNKHRDIRHGNKLY
jgi:NTP pyrophosphatase (non-canonical NTP hydrolase)